MQIELISPAEIATPIHDQLSSILSTLPAPPRLRDLQAAAIDDALTRCEGNRTRAARALGISLRTLQRKLGRTAGASVAINGGS